MELVSICIPTFERPDFLKLSIESALSQTQENLEVIVADNASKGHTQDVVQSFQDPRIRSFRHKENRGFIYNWNFCLEKSRGQWIKILGDDDILLPDAIEREKRVLQRESDVGFVCSNYLTIDQNGNPINTTEFNKSSFRIFPESRIESGTDFAIQYFCGKRRIGMPSAILFRKDLARKAGGFDPKAGCPADIDLWLRMARISNFYYLDKILMKMRRHAHNWSLSLGSYQDDIRVLKKHRDLIRSLPIEKKLFIAQRYFRLIASTTKGEKAKNLFRDVSNIFQTFKLIF